VPLFGSLPDCHSPGFHTPPAFAHPRRFGFAAIREVGLFLAGPAAGFLRHSALRLLARADDAALQAM